MHIAPITSRSAPPLPGSDAFGQAKQAFQKLGSALESGNLTDAKAALAQLQKNAPAQTDKNADPLAQKMEALGKAVDSGDLKAAQDAYADVKKTASQAAPGGGGRARGAGGPPPGGPPPSGAPAGGTPNSNKVYDKKDTNKDGTVSWQEEQDYYSKHPEESKPISSTTKSESDKKLIDIRV